MPYMDYPQPAYNHVCMCGAVVQGRAGSTSALKGLLSKGLGHFGLGVPGVLGNKQMRLGACRYALQDTAWHAVGSCLATLDLLPGQGGPRRFNSSGAGGPICNVSAC